MKRKISLMQKSKLRLKESEALSIRRMKDLSEKKRVIQEQAKLTKENENESSTDAPSAKDKSILVAAENNSRASKANRRKRKGG